MLELPKDISNQTKKNDKRHEGATAGTIGSRQRDQCTWHNMEAIFSEQSGEAEALRVASRTL